jgi:hypothetical protein
VETPPAELFPICANLCLSVVNRFDVVLRAACACADSLVAYPFALRCRTASNSVMIVAIATFNESACPAIGILT